MDDVNVNQFGQGTIPAMPAQPLVVAQLSQDQLLQLIQYAAQGPMQTMQNMHLASTQQFIQLQQQQLEMQRQVFERLANHPAADPAKKLLESDPPFWAKVRIFFGGCSSARTKSTSATCRIGLQSLHFRENP